MNAHDGYHDGPPNQIPGEQAITRLSRRDFLKLMGISGLILAGAGLDESSLASEAAKPSLGVRGPTGERINEHALAYALALLQQALDELRTYGFAFNLNQRGEIHQSSQPGILALMLCDTRLPPTPEGADLALTLNLAAPEHAVVQYVIGRSRRSALEIQRSVLDGQGRRVDMRQQVQRDASDDYHARVRGRHAWSEHTRWYYARCCQSAWQLDKLPSGMMALQLRQQSVLEYRDSRSRAAVTLLPGPWRRQTRRVSLDGAASTARPAASSRG
jgi:hypothetical protein